MKRSWWKLMPEVQISSCEGKSGRSEKPVERLLPSIRPGKVTPRKTEYVNCDKLDAQKQIKNNAF